MRSGKKQLVYFMKPVGMPGPIKIGCSNAPENRLAHLASWSPFPLEFNGTVHGCIADEMFMHDCFADLHTHHEWFPHSEELRIAIDEVIAAGTVSVLHGKLEPKGSIRKSRKSGWTPSLRLRASLAGRIRSVERVTYSDTHRFIMPDDVHRILRTWLQTKKTPNDADLKRLMEVADDPEAHMDSRPWKKEAA